MIAVIWYFTKVMFFHLKILTGQPTLLVMEMLLISVFYKKMEIWSLKMLLEGLYGKLELLMLTDLICIESSLSLMEIYCLKDSNKIIYGVLGYQESDKIIYIYTYIIAYIK